MIRAEFGVGSLTALTFRWLETDSGFASHLQKVAAERKTISSPKVLFVGLRGEGVLQMWQLTKQKYLVIALM